MDETALTQEIIDTGSLNETSDKEGLYSSATKHPLIAGGLVIAGAGLAYAVARAIRNADHGVARDVHIEASVTINRSPAELYTYWRDFTNLPLFMRNLESVSDLGNDKSHWVAKTNLGIRIEWDAEIYNEKENQLIAWRSLESADVVNAGSVRFQQAPGDRGTYVRVTVNYNPPAGKVGASLAALLGSEPRQLIMEDLRRFKQLMEAGEIATVVGQTSGRSRDVVPLLVSATTN